MKKRIVIIALVVALVATCFGGTIAYLTDTDSAVNTMTYGNVEIKQVEYQRAEGVADNATASVAAGTLVPFVQNQKISPATQLVSINELPFTAAMTKDESFKWGDYTYTGTSWNGLYDSEKLGNVIDKFVFVENGADNDVYFRTIVAFEAPGDMTVGDYGDNIAVNVNNGGYSWEDKGYTTIDGVRYFISVATYCVPNDLGVGVLPKSAKSHPSLLQFYLDPAMTNDQINEFQGTYDVLVMSQATQVEGFANAEQALDISFGDDTLENCAAWLADIQ